MCGISVLFRKENISSDLYSEFLQALHLIDHRGPDDEGIVLINTITGEFTVSRSQIDNISKTSCDWVQSYNLVLGHKRLSIVDLSGNGHQPMQGKNGSWIVFNGEIYNYIELKEELKKLGCIFHTHSDTEVILEAYRVWGEGCLKKFNGMWSFCIWDAPRKKLFVSNDRFGVKPLYYHESSQGLVLVSEIKQYKSYKNISSTINKKNLDDFINYGYLDTSENTIYNDIYRFKKAHYILVNLNDYQTGCINRTQQCYYEISQCKISISENEAKTKLRELLFDAVRLRMRADVDFGFAISGGLDSSAILYSARHIIQSENVDSELIGFSAIFPGYEQADESKYVNIVTDDLPCKTMYSNPMENFSIDAFEQHIYHQDEPIPGTSFLAEWYVYEKVKQSGIKILFNGQGADEVFAGYHHHFYRYCRQLLMRGNLLEYFSLVAQYASLKGLKKSSIHKIVMNEVKLRAKMQLGIAKFDNALVKYWNKIDSLDEILIRDLDTYQLPLYLRSDDRDSMAHSIESRHPFMDYRVIEFGYSLPDNLLISNGWQKSIIRNSITEMPEIIRYRKDKKGYTTPQEAWLEKYKKDFEGYLSYNERIFGERSPSKDKYKNYAIGAWLKMKGF